MTAQLSEVVKFSLNLLWGALVELRGAGSPREAGLNLADPCQSRLVIDGGWHDGRVRQLQGGDRLVIEAAAVTFGALFQALHQVVGHVAQGERGHQLTPPDLQKSR